MDLYNLFKAWVSIAPWLFGVMAYVLVSLLIEMGVYYVFGRRVQIWVIRIMLLPIWLVTELLARVYLWADTQRTKRHLSEVFGIEDPENRETNHVLIQQTLAELAIDLDRACLREEKLRLDTNLDRKELIVAGQSVRYWKARFWRAHALANNNGYYVASTYKEHLPDSYYWGERRALTSA